MNYPEQWSQKQVDSFYEWISRHPLFGEHVMNDFPDLCQELEGKGLRQEDADELAKYLKWLRILPFADVKLGREILVFYYTGLPRIRESLKEDPRGMRLCYLFPVLARMMFQGSSIFLVEAADLAILLMRCLRQYPRDAKEFEALGELLTDPADGRFLHGYNAEELTREQLNVLIASEHMRRAGNFETIYEAQEKYEGYKARLIENEEFRQDWIFLKKRFRNNLIAGKIVLRSRNRGGNDMRHLHSVEPKRCGGFQTVFNFFCWKWFLDGMFDEEPLVAKLSFDVTPFGTTIFIPGYWNFDPKRDIRWTQLLEPHRSRGVKRQGEAFEPNRLDRERKERVFLEAEKISQSLGESGQALVFRCIRMAGLPEETDPAHVYHVLEAARRKRTRVQPSELPLIE